MQDLWVFGYGSLMWRPGFDYVEQQPALLRGAHRSLCVYSVVHRGTKEKPGLVLGLDAGGSCRGIAFRVSGHNADETLEYLRAREQATMVYRETTRPVELLGHKNRTVPAVCFLVDRKHPQYTGRLSIRQQARLVLRGEGASGNNIEYVVNTTRHLSEMGLREHALLDLLSAIGHDASEFDDHRPPRAVGLRA